mmetsp:Transcript_578/g.754  ORF Transcript_578/g.754 Transcript_578/m.754 type:complete len:109 (-) Transcript_578:307-633(-)
MLDTNITETRVTCLTNNKDAGAVDVVRQLAVRRLLRIPSTKSHAELFYFALFNLQQQKILFRTLFTFVYWISKFVLMLKGLQASCWNNFAGDSPVCCRTYLFHLSNQH